MSQAVVRASGVGSWPSVGARDAVRTVRDLLLGEGADGVGVPYLPEQPGRGPGADMIGRSAGLLVEMSVDLQPSGWRLSSGQGRDLRRADSYVGEDLDELAEAYVDYDGPLKVQVVGPWTLAAGLWLPRGERVVADAGATRDLAQSMAAGVVQHVDRIRRLVPAAHIVLQCDEPSLPFVQQGQVRKASGYGTLRAPDRAFVEEVLRGFADELKPRVDRLIVHSCAPDVPISLLRRMGVDGLGLDLSLLAESSFEPLGESIDAGLELWAGIIPTSTQASHPATFVERFVRTWQRIGFGRAEYDRLVVTPACGLGRNEPTEAIRIQRLAVEAAAMLTERD